MAKKKNHNVIEFNGERLEAIRKEVEGLKDNPKYKQLSKAFRETLVRRVGAKNFANTGSDLKGVIPVPLKYLLNKIDLTKAENIDKLKEINISLENILEAAGVTDLAELRDIDELRLDFGKIAIGYDPDGSIFDHPFDDEYKYANVYNYRFW